MNQNDYNFSLYKQNRHMVPATNENTPRVCSLITAQKFPRQIAIALTLYTVKLIHLEKDVNRPPSNPFTAITKGNCLKSLQRKRKRIQEERESTRKRSSDRTHRFLPSCLAYKNDYARLTETEYSNQDQFHFVSRITKFRN